MKPLPLPLVQCREQLPVNTAEDALQHVSLRLTGQSKHCPHSRGVMNLGDGGDFPFKLISEPSSPWRCGSVTGIRRWEDIF